MKNNWLLFKQGFKGIFKFKIQFIIVLVLTFIASFYIGAATSLTFRMNEAYKVVMEGYDPFENTYSKRSNDSDLSNTSESYLSILDLLPSQNNNISSNKQLKNDSFNLVLNNFGLDDVRGYEKTFINQAFFPNGEISKPLEELWNYYYLTNDFYMWKNLSATEISDTGSTLQNYQGRNIKYNFANILPSFSTGSDSSNVQWFTFKLVKMLSQSFETQLKSSDPLQSMRDSLIYRYWETLPSTEKKFDALTLENMDNDNYINEVNSNGQFQVYVYNALEALAYNILDESASLIKNSYVRVLNDPEIKNYNWNQPGKEIPEIIESYLEKWTEIATRDGEMQLYALEHRDWEREASAIQWNKELVFEFLFGQKHTSWNGEPINKNFIVDKTKGTEDLYVNKSNNIEELKNFNVKLETTTNGLRGLVNPVNIEYDEEKDEIISIKSRKSTFSSFERISAGSKQAKYNNGKVSDYKQDSNDSKDFYRWNSLYANNIFHQKMAASLTELDLKIREEAFLYDRNTRTNFRFVILDDEYDYNFKIMAGVPVMQSKEIVISQQYAFKNNLKLGDSLKIGNDFFIISGFGSDILTYYPLVDTDVPITDSKSSVIVYVPKYVFKDFMKNNPDSSPDIIFSTHFFLDDAKLEKKTYENRLSKFDALQMNNSKSFARDFERAKDDKTSIFDSLNNLKIKKLSDTNFILNWSLQPKIISVINLSTIITSVIVLIMVILTLFFAIKKNIDYNSNQIGYLKAMGIGTYRLSLSYVSYSLIIGFIVIPIAWATSGFFQELVAKIFSTFFSTTLYQFVFSIKLLLILFLILGVGSFAISYFSALLLNRKNVLQIINKDNIIKKRFNIRIKWFKSRIISFKFLLPFKIAVRGLNQIIAISITSMLVSIIITVSISVPSVLSIYIRDAGKYFDFENQYSIKEVPSGLPTAKKTLTASYGYLKTNELHEEPKVLTERVGTANKISDIYFDNNKYYTDQMWDSSILPIITYGQAWQENAKFENGFNWTEKYILDKAPAEQRTTYAPNEIESSNLVKIITPLVGQIGNINAINLSGGIFEKIASLAWNSDINPNNGDKYFSDQSTNVDAVWKLKRDTYVANTEYLVTLLQLIFDLLSSKLGDGSVAIEPPEDPSDWKQQFISAIGALLPLSGQKYLKDSPNRGTQFALSFNSENYVPLKESLSSELKATINQNINSSESVTAKEKIKSIKLTGLKNNQTAYSLSKEEGSKVFIEDSEVINKLNELFAEKEKYNGGDIIFNDMLIYDSVNKNLNIPTISNLKNYQQYKMKQPLKLDEFKNKVLKWDNLVIPKNAWVYDNREISENLDKIDPNREYNLKESKWLNPDSIDPNKYTYNQQFDYGENDGDISKVKSSSKWFINSSFNNNIFDINNLNYEFRPYYHYNNLKLFLPVTSEVGMSELLNGANSTNDRKSNFANSDWRANKDIWHGKISYSDVPEQVKQAWGYEYSDKDWEWIAPYSISYSAKRKNTNPSFIDGDDFVTSIQFIFSWAGDKIKTSGDSRYIVISDDNTKFEFLNNINLVSVGTIDTYNGDFTLVDQDIINLLSDKSTEKYIPVDYDYYGDPIKELPDGKMNYQDHTITVRNMKTPLQLFKEMSKNKNFFMKKELMEKDLTESEALSSVIQNRDFNSKYSSFSESYGVTLAAKIYSEESPGIVPIEAAPELLGDSIGSVYSHVDLVGLKMGLITTVSETILLFSVFLISGLMVISMLIILVIADIYIMKYHKFIITMRALGYGKTSIIVNSVLLPAIVANILVVVGYYIGKYWITIGLLSFTSFGIYIPFIVHPWVPLLIMSGMFMLFAVGYIISLKKPMTDKVHILM